MKWLFAVLLSLLCITPALGDDWELFFPGEYPVPNGTISGSFSDDTIAVWDKVVFITEENTAGILDDDGYRSIQLPYGYGNFVGFNAKHLAQIGGQFYFWISYYTPQNWTNEEIYSTTDFLDYATELSWTGGITIYFPWLPALVPASIKKSYGRIVVIERTSGKNYPVALKIFDGEEWMNYPLENLQHQLSDAVYLPRLDSPVLLNNDNQKVSLEVPTESGELSPFVSFEVESWPGYFRRLTCLDEDTVVAFGNSSELALISSNGTVRLSHPWKFYPPDDYRIESIQFVNGWYYLVGSATIRTRDFNTFEKVETPFGKELVAVRHYRKSLLGFLEDAIFKQPLQTSYLDSVEPKPGWHHSDWLGWFQVIDEELGDIDHLLLGKCWIKQTSELEYWIRTEALGWIYMRKDWSPWFWRMEDGHWYWLDHDSWPRRAWDDDDQEWEELDLRESAQSADEPLS